MQLSDPLYGTFDITEPVLAELIDSRAVQRLKGIDQYGVPAEFYHYPSFSRYDHSIGVMLLLRKLGASLQEQIAGLLHDISHTAFSHVIDWVIGDPLKENYQDYTHHRFMKLSDVVPILERYDFQVDTIADLESHGLVDRPIPELCADRIDYSLREFRLWANPSIVQQCIDSLTVYQNRIVFNSRDAANAFGRAFLKVQTEHWGGKETTIKYHTLSQLLKTALEQHVVTIEDFYEDDARVMAKLKQAADPRLEKLLVNMAESKVTETDAKLTFRKKFRYVDPLYLDNGVLHRLSETDEAYKNFVETHRQRNIQGIRLSS